MKNIQPKGTTKQKFRTSNGTAKELVGTGGFTYANKQSLKHQENEKIKEAKRMKRLRKNG